MVFVSDFIQKLLNQFAVLVLSERVCIPLQKSCWFLAKKIKINSWTSVSKSRLLAILFYIPPEIVGVPLWKASRLAHIILEAEL